MSRDLKGAARPQVNHDLLQKRLLLQMELMRHDARRGNQARRDQVAAELKKLARPARPRAARSRETAWYQGLSMSYPVAPVRFLPGGLSLGYSGTIQLDSAQEGTRVYPPGVRGMIETLALDGRGGAFFTGDIAAARIEGYPTNPGTLVEATDYFWLQNFDYVMVFPPAVVQSRFTYAFRVDVQVVTGLVDGSALGWSYVSVGETADRGAHPIVVDTGVGFPLAMVDLNPPTGVVQGQLHVQRSFVVQGGHTPAVVMVAGIAVDLTRNSEVIFSDAQDCFIMPGSDIGGEGVVHFRYDPMLSVSA